MKGNKMRFYIVLAAVLVLFCVIALLVPFARGFVFWLSFAAAVFAILIQLYAMPRAMQGDARSKYYGFPILRISFIYLVVQLALSLVFMALGSFIPWWVPAMVYIVLACVALVGFVAADSVREEVQQQDEEIKNKVQLMRSLQSRANVLAAQFESGEAGKALKKFAEDMRYSDPVSVETIADAEAELIVAIDSLQQAVIDGSEADIVTLCRKATAALAERNRLCKLNKH